MKRLLSCIIFLLCLILSLYALADATQIIIPEQSIWKFYAGVSYPDTSWNLLSYNDDDWPDGPGVLGYGESYIATTLSYGPDANNKYITTCLRVEFELNAAQLASGHLVLNANYDDGFVAHINGVEVARRSMPVGIVEYATLAYSHEGGAYEAIDLSTYQYALNPGTNILAVEVHQRDGSSSDLVWDAGLVLDDALVEFVWSGAVTDSSAKVNAKILRDSSQARLAISEDSSFAAPIFSPPDSAIFADNNGVVALAVDGLLSDHDYFYAIEVDNDLDTNVIGHFRTFPSGPASFKFAYASCARTASNHAVFETIRGSDPLFFLHMGDFHYQNISVNDRNVFRHYYNVVLTTPRQAQLYQEYPIAYMWDDHDYGPNNSDSTAPGREAARLTYREYVPHYPLPAGEGNAAIYYASTVGRVRFIVTDSRSARSPAAAPDIVGKTMLGESQKSWFKQELLDGSQNYPLVVWVNTLPWIGDTGDDGWHLYTHERQELADFIKDNQIKNLCMLSGDAHMIAIDDGTNSDYAAGGGAGFPVMHAGSLDQTPSVKGGPYSHGAYPARGQFGEMTVIDSVAEVYVIWRGLNYNNQEIVRYDFRVSNGVISSIICGDATGDEIVNLADAIQLINYVFKGGAAPAPLSSGDANCDGEVNIGDAVYLINYLNSGGPEPCCL